MSLTLFEDLPYDTWFRGAHAFRLILHCHLKSVSKRVLEDGYLGLAFSHFDGVPLIVNFLHFNTIHPMSAKARAVVKRRGHVVLTAEHELLVIL